jgi:hypothetical protein
VVTTFGFGAAEMAKRVAPELRRVLETADPQAVGAVPQ